MDAGDQSGEAWTKAQAGWKQVSDCQHLFELMSPESMTDFEPEAMQACMKKVGAKQRVDDEWDRVVFCCHVAALMQRGECAAVRAACFPATPETALCINALVKDTPSSNLRFL